MSISRQFKTVTAVPIEPAEIEQECVFLGSSANPTKSAFTVSDYVRFRRVGKRVLLRFSYSHSAAGTDGTGTYSLQLPYKPNGNGFVGCGTFFTGTLSTVPMVIQARTLGDMLITFLDTGVMVTMSSTGSYFAENFMTITGQIEYDTDEA